MKQGQARAIAVRSIELAALDLERGIVELELRVSKGYYVRALARDLGTALGLPAHLAALRRTASGAFELGLALALGDLGPETPLMPVAEAARLTMPHAELTPIGADRARHGKPLGDGDFVKPPATSEPSAWLGQGELVAVGARRGEDWRVIRGFRGNGAASGERGSGTGENGP